MALDRAILQKINALQITVTVSKQNKLWVRIKDKLA